MELASLHFMQLAWNKIINIFSFCVKSEIEDTVLGRGQKALSWWALVPISRPLHRPALAVERRAGRGFAGSGLWGPAQMEEQREGPQMAGAEFYSFTVYIYDAFWVSFCIICEV